MDTIKFWLLGLLYLTSGSNSFDIVPSGTAWLGETLTLRTEIQGMKRPVIWKSGTYAYECDKSCTSGNYAVTHVGKVSTLTIKSVSWNFSKWNFEDADLHYAYIDLDIKVKPRIEIKNTTNCEYNVTAECSLPETDIKCFLETKLLTFTSNNTKNCTDGKAFTSSAILNPSTGNLKCSFTMDNIFSEERTTEVNCNIPSGITTSSSETTSSSSSGITASSVSVNDNKVKSFAGGTSTTTTPATTTKSSVGDNTKQKNYISIIIGVLLIIGFVDI